MKCPFCAHVDDKVIDSREGRSGDTIRRRRECLKCGRRFTTYERIDEIPYMVIKKDGRRERFERQKILQGLLKACEKRPVPTPKLEAIVDEIEGVVHEATERELTTTEIGEMISARSDGARADDDGNRRNDHAPAEEARQGGVRAICQRVHGLQRRSGVHERAEEFAEGSRQEMTRSALQIFLKFASSFVEIDLELNYDAQALVGEPARNESARGGRKCLFGAG